MDSGYNLSGCIEGVNSWKEGRGSGLGLRVGGLGQKTDGARR